jgi:hypothetical protein
MGEVNLSAMWWCPISLEQATGNLHSGTKMGEIQDVRIPDIFRFLNMETTVHVLVWSYFSLLSETTRNVFHVFELFLPCIVWDLMFLQQWVLSLLSYRPWQSYPSFNTIWMVHHPETSVITYHTSQKTVILTFFFVCVFIQMVLGFSIYSTNVFV